MVDLTDISFAALWTVEFWNSKHHGNFRKPQNQKQTKQKYYIYIYILYIVFKKCRKICFYKNKHRIDHGFSRTPMTKAANKTQHGTPFSQTGPWRTASCHCRGPCEGLQPLQHGCGRWHRSPRRISRAVGTQHRPWRKSFWGVPLFGKCCL